MIDFLPSQSIFKEYPRGEDFHVMSTTRHLLAATDFSDHARNAVHRAALIATEQQAPLELLHVISGSIGDALRKLLPATADVNEKLAEDARGLLNALASVISETTGLTPRTRVTVGRVPD